MSERGDESWRRAAQHPVRTIVLGFVVVAGVMGGYVYLRYGSVGQALAAAIGCGAIVTWGALRNMRRVEAGLTIEPPKGVSPGSLLAIGVGLALVLWGAASGSRGIAVAGLPLLVLGLALIGLRLFLRRRADDR